MSLLREILHALGGLSKETWIAWSFVPIAAAFMLALWRADRGNSSTFKLIHFVTTDTGRGSNKELGYTMLVVVSAWGIWALILLDKLTEWYIYGVLGAFVIGSLGAKWTQMKARAAAVPEPEASAGDDPAAEGEPLPALERKTRIETTERVPANPLADPAGKPIQVEVANTEPIATTETPAGKSTRKRGK